MVLWRREFESDSITAWLTSFPPEDIASFSTLHIGKAVRIFCHPISVISSAPLISSSVRVEFPARPDANIFTHWLSIRAFSRWSAASSDLGVWSSVASAAHPFLPIWTDEIVSFLNSEWPISASMASSKQAQRLSSLVSLNSFRETNLRRADANAPCSLSQLSSTSRHTSARLTLKKWIKMFSMASL